MIIDNLPIENTSWIADGICEMVFGCGVDMPKVSPGQFISIYPKNPALTLPRPISICDVYEGRIKIVFRIAGNGTQEFSNYKVGESAKVMYPLGNGFNIEMPKGRDAVLVGGGIGVPPLVFLARMLYERGVNFSVFLGFQNEPILIPEFERFTDKVYIATETGVCGDRGNVLELLKRHNANGTFYSCGPLPMLKAIGEYANEKGCDCQVSLEERMACGFGACIGCAVKVKKQDWADWQFLKVCKDGPVFNSSHVFF